MMWAARREQLLRRTGAAIVALLALLVLVGQTEDLLHSLALIGLVLALVMPFSYFGVRFLCRWKTRNVRVKTARRFCAFNFYFFGIPSIHCLILGLIHWNAELAFAGFSIFFPATIAVLRVYSIVEADANVTSTLTAG